MDMRKLLEAVTKFAGEPEQKPGEQWKGTDSAPPGKKLVGDSIIKDLAKGPTPKTKEQELAEAYAKFLEDNLGVEEKRPSRKGSRPARDMGKTGEPSKLYTSVKEGWGRGNDRVTLPDDSTLYWSGNGPLQDEYDALYNELVPSQGKADTIEGEVLRAASKIVYRHYNDGDEFNQASFEQLVPYIGAVTSYDDLAHKSTEFAIKANGNYTPNPNWDSLDVMEYGPEEDDYDDEEDDDWDDEYEDPNEEDDEEVDEGRTTWNSDWYVYNPETLAVKKKFRTYKGAKQYAEANGLKLAASEWYHDKINTQKQTDEGWESGPEERSSSRERDPDDAYDDMRQQKADDEAERQQARRPQEQYYTLTGRGPNMEPNYAFPGEYSSQEDAVAARARLMADPKTPNPRMIGISKRTRYLDLKEGIESADPVEGAVLAAVQELIQQGHTEVAPEVITNMVVAATSQPFLLKDLVDANNNSPAVQHYIDSINPTKVKFSNEILTVKNEDPLKDKKQAQAGVANMAARAAGRNRLGENSVTPLKDKEDLAAKNKALSDLERYPELSADVSQRKQVLAKQAQDNGIKEGKVVPVITAFRKGMEKIAASDMNPQAKQAAFDRLSAEFHRNAEAYSQAVKSKKKVAEAGSAIGGGATSSSNTAGAMASPEDAKKAVAATSQLKSATGSQATPDKLMKALDAASQGTQVGAQDMKVLEPMMDVVASAAKDPKLANQFKTLANQARQSQKQQQK
jgi:hypothetical protein